MIILITSIGANSAITATKLFIEKDVKIIGTDLLKPFEIAGSKFCDVFYTIPRCTEGNFIEEILKICKKENIDAILPMYDSEIEVLSKEKDKLGEIKMIASPYRTVKTCNDKWETYQFFLKNGIPTPKTFLKKE